MISVVLSAMGLPLEGVDLILAVDGTYWICSAQQSMYGG